MFGISAAGALVIGAGAGIALSSMGSDGPDTSGMNDAARSNAALSKEQLDWAKQIYEETRPQRAEATHLALEQARTQNNLSSEQLQTSRTQRERYDRTFAPIEDRIALEAKTYDTPARREEAARAAVADTEMALENQRGATERAMERRGVIPGSGQQLALAGTMDLGAAKLKAGAANSARKQVETVGAAKLADAAAMGRGVFTNQGTAASLAVNAGNSAVGNAQVPGNVTAQGDQIMQQGFQTAIQGNNSAGNLYGQAASIQQKADDNSGAWGALGQVAGAYLASDKNIKTDIQSVDGEVSLRAVRRMPVKGWKYKKGSVADDGGKPHVGPMAQDVNAAAGERVAPGGKKIDLITMNGITLAAVQALDKKVAKLSQAKHKR